MKSSTMLSRCGGAFLVMLLVAPAGLPVQAMAGVPVTVGGPLMARQASVTALLISTATIAMAIAILTSHSAMVAAYRKAIACV